MAKQGTDVAETPSEYLDGFGERDRTAMENMSFQEMMDAGVISIDEIDDVVTCDQAELVGKPFILFDWEIKQSQTFGGSYALCRVKVENGTRVFADGGVGIQEQLTRYEDKMRKTGIPFAPIYFQKGLRASSYMANVPDEKTGEMKQIPATTYYLDNQVD